MGTGYTPSTVQSGFQSSTLFNSELPAIQQDLEDKIDRLGRLPNAMMADLDIGTNQLLNVEEGVLGTDGVNLNQVVSLATDIAETIAGTGGIVGGGENTLNTGTTTGSTLTMGGTELDLATEFPGIEDINAITVFVNGILQVPGLAYTIVDLVLTFSEPLLSDSEIFLIFGDITPTPIFDNVNASLSEVASTATVGQTVFTAPTYTIGLNHLLVFIDGIKQTLSLGDYTETTTTSITLDEAMSGGEVIVITEITGS